MRTHALPSLLLCAGLALAGCAPARPAATPKPEQNRLAVEPDDFETWFRLRRSARSRGAMGASRNLVRLLDEQEPVFVAACHREINRPHEGCQIGSDQLLVLAAVLSDGRLVDLTAPDGAEQATTHRPLTSRRLPGLMPYLSMLSWYGGSAGRERLGRPSVKAFVPGAKPDQAFQVLALGACPGKLLATRPLTTGGEARKNLEALADTIGRDRRLADAAWVQIEIAGDPAQLGLAEDLRYIQAALEGDEEEGLGISKETSAGSCQRTYTLALARPGQRLEVLRLIVDDTSGQTD